MRQDDLTNSPVSPIIKFLKSIIIVIIMVFGLYFAMQILMVLMFAGTTRWHVRKISSAERQNYAEYAFLPGIDDALERFATRGWQDVESQLETYAYKSLDELCDALPEGCGPAVRNALMSSTPTEETDVKGKTAQAYLITDDLPIKRDETDEQVRYERRNYYVYKYKNGKYRFVIQGH